MKIDLQACICIGSGRFVHLNMKGFASASELLWNNQCCGSKMSITDPNFFHPESGFLPSGSWIRIKEFKYFNPSSRKYDPSCSSRIRILIFYPDPGVNKAPDLGSGSATLELLSFVFQNPHQINGRKVDVKKALPKEETRGGAGIIYYF